MLGPGLAVPLATMTLLGACGAPASPERESIVLWGHGYALFVEPPHLSAFVTDARWRAFAAAVARIAPVAAFGLGDHTFHSTAAEWQLLLPHLGALDTELHLLRGNHDTGTLPHHPDLALDRPNKIVDRGRLRFLLLDARQVWSKDDLAFVAGALAGHEQRAHTFVLTHFPPFAQRPLAEAPAGVDVTQPYSGYGNWNEDVAPLLRGAVRYVFCGDTYERLAGWHEGPDGITYICCGFSFRGGGPAVFLELQLEEDALVAILPHAVPIDVRDGWYDEK